MERKLLFHISFKFHRDTIAMEEKKCLSTKIKCLVLQHCGEQMSKSRNETLGEIKIKSN